MGKKSKFKKAPQKKTLERKPVVKKTPENNDYYKWLFPVLLITAVCLFPMLSNEFTNWDDQAYVLKNNLLVGPDWSGIFSEPVVGNYHPLTMLSLAFNYAISGTEPFSYLLLNYLLHLLNTFLVFAFIYKISGKKTWVAAFTALIFGIHPMHVESVAWVSERKDVLYTFFFLLSLTRYWEFLVTKKSKEFWLAIVFFILSLLSKPSAVILPLVLLLLDYWHGRSIDRKAITEKTPFFILSLAIGIATIQIQKHGALTSIEVYSITDRLLFGCYVLVMYLFRFFIPYPMSTLHPFPPADNLGWPVLISPLILLALLVLLWLKRKDKVIVFGSGFFVINLLLVMQVLTVGISIISERYTYVPYIGLAFSAGMKISNLSFNWNKIIKPMILAVMAAFCVLTWQRTGVWKNSGTLWDDVLEKYPGSPHALTNKADYLSKIATEPEWANAKDSLYTLAVRDCETSLKLKSNHASAYEILGLINIDKKNFNAAFSYADSLTKYKPDNKMGYDIRGTVYFQHNDPVKALAQFDTCIILMPDDHRSFNNRGTIYLSGLNKYNEALADFSKAISLNPLGSYYLNRSICYFHLGNMINARADAETARQKGTVVSDQYMQSLNK